MESTKVSTQRQLEPSVARVSAALRKLATAASTQFGADCYFHMELGRVLLADLGVEAYPALGFVAWRVGAGDGDVIAHSPYTPGQSPIGVNSFPYHAWLQCHGLIVDFTTYQLKHKAQQLDASDGGHTTVTWCPDFLILPPEKVKTYRQVANALHPGIAYYEKRPELKAALRPPFGLDPVTLHVGRALLASPAATIYGPNDLARERSGHKNPS